MKVDIHSDVACPWCYIGQARFERALADFERADEVEVRYRPYQLDPRAPMHAEPMLDYLARRFGARGREMANHVIEIARAEGLVMNYDHGLAVNTLNAHRLLALAEQEHGVAVQRTLVRQLFAAHFAEGLDVGDTRVLSELAAGVGMNAERVLAYLDSDAGTLEVREEITAAQRLGVNVVPTYVFDDRYIVEGAQPSELFLQALNMVSEESSASDEPSVTS